MQRLFVVFCTGIVLFVRNSVVAQDDPIVRVRQGSLRGKEETSVLNKTFFSFKGIPYARPPLGSLRFKDAQPPESWTGTRNATKHGSICTQFDSDTKEYLGNEDCLFLNVYTPKLPAKGSKRLPVMFCIPGGGFVFGSGNSDVYGPDFLVNEGIVLVTINYRLGCFGFLFLNKAAPGNVGLKDQVFAMRWVKENIGAFNGDPNKVTIFGQSAGSTSVGWHMITPMTKGLFRGAIGESGAIMNQWGIQYEPYETSLRLAKAVGCTGGDDNKIVDCLRKVNNIKLFRAANTKALAQRDIPRLDREAFVPTVEELEVICVERFVIGAPEQLLKHGCIHDVPFMTGINDQEWMYNLAANNSKEPGLLQSEASLRRLDANWTAIVYPETRFPEDLDSSDIFDIIQKMRDFYIGGTRLSTENVQGYRNMISDLQYGEGTMYEVNYISKANTSPTYLYLFTVDQKLNFLKALYNITIPGASHADDNGYLFKVRWLPTVDSDDPAAVSRRRMLRLWSNFAKTGNPTPTEDELIGLEWKPYTSEERNYFQIGNELSTGKDLYPERFRFWEDLYEQYGAQREGGGWWKTCAWYPIVRFFERIHSIVPSNLRLHNLNRVT